MLNNNLLALIITFLAAIGWLRLMDFIADRGWISSKQSRKIIHIGTGPIFVLCWLLFDADPNARWLAALVPGLITLQFIMVGLGLIKDEAAVQAMSRSGDRREILRGPLYYGIVFVALTLIFWKDSPVGITGLMILCGGDGLADLAGRHKPLARLPWSPEKSWGGSLAVFAGGALMSLAVLWAFTLAGVLAGPFSGYFLPVVVVALGCTVVESLPFKEVDNLFVSLAAVVLGLILF
jgi:phytol kinase